jgi:hypothetical protein
MAKQNSKIQFKSTDWTKTPAYREAILLKILRAMKSYGFAEWMREDLKKLGLSI